MKEISHKDHDKFIDNNAIFFVNSSVIIEPKKRTPIIKFKQNIAKIKKLYLYNELLFADIHADSFATKAPTMPVKLLIRETSSIITKQIIQGFQWVQWAKNHAFCSHCAHELLLISNSFEKKCSQCNMSFYPNLAPAIMVLIIKEQKILLARNHDFNNQMYSALAGFIDLGESAKAAANREVLEEVGLKITNLKYFGSQSWPFPGSFMIAFTANYLSGKINIQTNELADAQWFELNNLPNLPSLPSISRQLINHVINQKL